MRRILFRVGLVIGSLAVLGGVAWAAWTQGEAAGYGKGYAVGREEERAQGPRMAEKDALALASTYLSYKAQARYDCADAGSAKYNGSGTWVVQCRGLGVAISDRTGAVTGP